MILILHQLQRHERIDELAGVASALCHDFVGFDQGFHRNLADIIGDDEAIAMLPTPDPAELTTDRVTTLIDDLIAEVRTHIAHLTPEPAEAPTNAVRPNSTICVSHDRRNSDLC